MTAPATLPRPAHATATPGAARTSATPRQGGTGAATGFAQLLRGQDEEAPMATAMAAADTANRAGAAPASDSDSRQARPAERERERKHPAGADDANAAAQPAAAAPAATPRPEAPSAWALAGLGSQGVGSAPGTATATTDANATSPAPAATPAGITGGINAGGSDPLAALRDAMGHSLSTQRRHGASDDRRADRGSDDGAARADPAAFGRALGDATADAVNANTSDPAAALPAAAPEPVAPAADGALPSLGAITDPARALHTPAPIAAEAAAPAAQASLPASPGTPAFGPALGLQLSTWLKDGVQHASLELHPQDLGPIDVRIAVKDGQTRIDLTADVASTRQALVDAMPQLSAALGDVGLSLSGGGVADPSAQGQQGGSANTEAGRNAGRASARMTAGVEGTEAAGRAPAAARQHRGLLDLYA